MERFTTDDILATNPCSQYSDRERLEKVYHDPGLTALEISERPIPRNDQRLLAVDIAESVLGVYEAHYPGDTRIRDYIEGIRKSILWEMTQEDLNVLYSCALRTTSRAYACNAFRAANSAHHVSFNPVQATVYAASVTKTKDNIKLALKYHI